MPSFKEVTKMEIVIINILIFLLFMMGIVLMISFCFLAFLSDNEIIQQIILFIGLGLMFICFALAFILWTQSYTFDFKIIER